MAPPHQRFVDFQVSDRALPRPLIILFGLTSHVLTQFLLHFENFLSYFPPTGPWSIVATFLDLSVKVPLFLTLSTPGLIFGLVSTAFKLTLLFTIDTYLTFANLYWKLVEGTDEQWGEVLASAEHPHRLGGSKRHRMYMANHPTIGRENLAYPPPTPPTSTDSRGPCPALNALCNHGILPRDGKKINLDDMGRAIGKTYNCAPTFVKFAVEAMRKNFGRDWINMGDLGAHNVIEHDASLIRHDVYFAPDQAKIAPDLVNSLTVNPTRLNPDTLTIYDIARFSSLRRAQSLATNPHTAAKLEPKHALFGANNAALLLVIWGGDVKAIEKFLLTETLEDGWLPATANSRYGATFLEFNIISIRLELSTQLDKIILRSQITDRTEPKYEDIKWGNLRFNTAIARGVPVMGVVTRG